MPLRGRTRLVSTVGAISCLGNRDVVCASAYIHTGLSSGWPARISALVRSHTPCVPKRPPKRRSADPVLFARRQVVLLNAEDTFLHVYNVSGAS